MIIFLIGSHFLKTKLLTCLWKQCPIDEFQKEYQSNNYTKYILLIQIICTIILKIYFLERISERERKATLSNISSKKFTIFLKKIDKKFNSGDLIQFFEHDLNKKVKIINEASLKNSKFFE